MKLKVKIIDQKHLELLEDGKIGDSIDLDDIVNVDTSSIIHAIEQGKDHEYQKLLTNEKAKMQNNFETELKLALANKEKELSDQLNALEAALKEQQFKEKEKSSDLLKTIEQKDLEIANLKEQYKKEAELNFLKEKEQLLFIHQQETTALKEQLNTLALEKEKLIYQKASMNVKVIGESLEKYCNREALAYLENGLLNCTWEKDNQAMKDDDDEKGTKGDFIFKVYVDESHQEPLIASVCLEMKDENPNSTNKKKDRDYFKRLNENRNKKNLQYAVLVSNLESESEANPPIYRVKDYPDMYVVRPNYMMVFLNMLASLSLKFSRLIKEKAEHEVMLKNKLEFEAEFAKLKNTYLEKPIDQMANELNNILNNAIKIKDLAADIEKTTNKIIDDTIDKIKDKVAKFELEMNRQYKKRGKEDEKIN